MVVVSQHPVVTAVRRFVADEVRPVASDLEHADAYPHALVARMRELGLFGALVPQAYGGLGLPVGVYAEVIEELCRGWMSLAGVINSHTMMALIVATNGTEEQKQRFLPRFARGEARGGLGLTEPHAGSDVQAIRTRARRDGDEYVIDGTKMFITNGREGSAFALLAVTDPAAQPRHRGMSCFVVEKGAPGFTVGTTLAKLGYKGVDTVELLFEGFRVPAANLIGGVEGRGFGHVMSGLEVGRINIAARCVGVAQAALDDARAVLRDSGRAATRSSARATGAAGAGGRTLRDGPGPAPDALADLATRVDAARLITRWAAGMKDRQERCDLEAGLAKLFASESAQVVAVGAMRLMGEAGVLTAHTAERHYRDTPLMIIGEGTNEIQRTLIARQLVDRHGERPGALLSRDGERDERRQLVLAVRQFVDKSLAPVVSDHDRTRAWPATLAGELAELGVLGAVVDPARGGLGLDLAATAMILEELARGWTTVACAVAAHLTATFAIEHGASPAVRERVLPAMTRGERLGTAVFGDGVIARGPRGRDRDPAARVLAGTTGLADNAPRAQWFVIEATAPGGGREAVLVHRGARGVAPGAVAGTIGQRGLDPCPLVLDRVTVPGEAALGDAEPVRAFATVAAAAIAVGLGQAAFEAALRYAQQRSTFGKPIVQHQAVQLMLADMATRLTVGRLLTGRAAETAGRGAPAAREAAMARLWAATAAYETALEAMRIHGGYGYVSEFPVERYYRDAARLAVTPVPDAELRRALARAVAETA